jgi:hypothetical protein
MTRHPIAGWIVALTCVGFVVSDVGADGQGGGG